MASRSPGRAARRARLTGSFEALVEVVAAVLGADAVGLHDNVLASVDDDTAQRVADAIADRFGLVTTVDVVRRYPTLAELGSHLGVRRPRGSPLVVPIGDGAIGTPIFFAAGGGAPAAQLHALADAFSPRPFYGIQARGLEERALPDRRVPAFAARALRDVRAIRPTGPYVLGGHSFGTTVAFEMACRLRDAGDDVELLVLLDTPAPPWASSRAVRRRSSVGLRANVRADVMALKRSARRLRRTTLGIVPRGGLAQYDEFYELSMAIGRGYDPGRRCDAPTLIVRAADVAYFPDPTKDLPDIGWQHLLAGPVTCADTAGDHLTMIRRPFAANVAGLVERCLGAEPELLRE